MPFSDIKRANAAYSADHEELSSGQARLGLAIVTCIDTRIDPLAAFGLTPGDAKVIRNAGARVTDDVMRTLIIAVHVLGVKRVALIQHTDCGVAKNDQKAISQVVEELTGEQVGEIDFLTIQDQYETLHEDAEKIRNHPLMPSDIVVGEFMFDVHNGRLTEIA